MKIQLINDRESIAPIRKSWRELSAQFPFLGPSWMVSWLDQYADIIHPAVLVGYTEQNSIVGIAPFCVDHANSRFQRRMRLIGSGCACSDYLKFICKPEFQKPFAEAVADWMFDNVRPGGPLGPIDIVELEGVAESDPDINYFENLMDAFGFGVRSESLEGCWAVDLPPTWEELNASFSKAMRRKTKKAKQRIEDTQTEIVTSSDLPFEQLWTVFIDLHQKRRQMLGQMGCFADESFESFLRDAASQLVSEDRASLLQINYSDQPLASVLMFHDNSTTYLYQSGMEPSLASREPGYQFVMLAIQNAMSRGMDRFDFLRGDEPYKARWSTTRIPLMRKSFVPRNFRSRLKQAIWTTGKTVKNQILLRTQTEQ